MTLMTIAALPTKRLAYWLIGGCALAIWSPATWSADTAATSALKVLLGPQAAFQQTGGQPPTPVHLSGSTVSTPSSAATGQSQQVGPTVIVQRGETLDRLIRRALPHVPLHPDFLRKAFVSLNPQVFPSGSPNQMRSGVALQVPSMMALRQMMLSQHPGSAALLQAHDLQADPNSQTSNNASNETSQQHRWVRFP